MVDDTGLEPVTLRTSSKQGQKPKEDFKPFTAERIASIFG